MQLGIKKPKINLNYKVSESGTSEKSSRRENSDRNTVLTPEEDIRKKNNQNLLKKQGSSYSTNDKLIFDPKKYVNFN